MDYFIFGQKCFLVECRMQSIYSNGSECTCSMWRSGQKKLILSFFSFFSQLCTIGFAGRRARIFTRARAAPVILVRSNLFKVWESLFAHFYKRSSILSLSESGICLDPDHSLPKFHPHPPLSLNQSLQHPFQSQMAV